MPVSRRRVGTTLQLFNTTLFRLHFILLLNVLREGKMFYTKHHKQSIHVLQFAIFGCAVLSSGATNMDRRSVGDDYVFVKPHTPYECSWELGR